MRTILWVAALTTFAVLRAADTESSARTRVERVPVAGGAELVTVFAIRPPDAQQRHAQEEVPIVSIVRDYLNDPATERLRNVWVLTYARPNWAQRIAAAFPFYFRSWAPSVKENRPPPAILNLSNPERNTWTGLVGALLQSEVLDGEGIFWRAPTRGYRSVWNEYRSMRM